MEFHELSSDDLDNWNKDLPEPQETRSPPAGDFVPRRSRVSSAFESADTVFFPYGLYKMAASLASNCRFASFTPNVLSASGHDAPEGEELSCQTSLHSRLGQL